MSAKDEFIPLETIGTGSFGTVSKIRRKTDDKVLVWKEINFGKMSEKEKSQLVAEVNIIRELKNPFIVKYHDRIVDKTNTRLYIIMEYCSGGDLGRLVSKARKDKAYIDEQFVWKVFAQSVLALKECHKRVDEHGIPRPVLHRDIKPANFLLDSHQNIKIADFGLAKELSSHTKFAQTNVGTPLYMAPEIINEKNYDDKSDIWSLGCLLYELAALRPPFEASNVVALGNKINQGRYTRIPSRFSESLSDAIRLLLQIEPKRRPKIEDLEALGALQPHIQREKLNIYELKVQHEFEKRVREVDAREKAAKAKDEELTSREKAIAEKEKSVSEREKSLSEKEKSLTTSISKFRQQQQQQQQPDISYVDIDALNKHATAAQPSQQPAQQQQPSSAGFTIFSDTSKPSELLPPSSASSDNLLATKRINDRIAARPLAPTGPAGGPSNLVSNLLRAAPSVPSTNANNSNNNANMNINVNINTHANKENAMLMPPPPPYIKRNSKTSLDVQQYESAVESPAKKARHGLQQQSGEPSNNLIPTMHPSHVDVRAMLKQQTINGNANYNPNYNAPINRFITRAPPAPPARASLI